ncbi:family 10 glycosylhydrolase [Aliifodinibius salicampi]|uniref:Family 10 glycosylhydrolase n=1 Tax=Fodinibius salicampi TaxID=1920655 RepID=A0ABT3PWL1_9BACT|nr:family 10 glycosylhydrolase [Fodinibius salicampi]MCW9712186.1 family 10 glycosylhydrolase [Fodinibius salicampi]
MTFERALSLTLFIAVVAASCTTTKPVSEPERPENEGIVEQRERDEEKATKINIDEIPKTPREFRGAWIATVDNIDWPSDSGLTVSEQKKELRAIMDRAVLLNLNAIIFQVRPSADAFYNSPYEPWSAYLTGKQGEPPEPYYDPLKFAVEEAHRRGLELHAWFNPFRAHHPAARGPLAPNHIRNRKSDLVVSYGSYLWLDPGKEEARQYSIDVIADVVRRYDIDGVHLDDYFYPYPAKSNSGQSIGFPDYASYAKFRDKTTSGNRNEWRRENINTFVKRLNEEIKLIDPKVRFGISPFGIWRPGHPEQIEGFDAYNEIFADARKWLREGWVDYLTPQLYWPISQQAQSFPVLLEWWQQQNIKNRHLWPGLYTSKLLSTSDGWSSEEIAEQIQIIRNQPGAEGAIHFSMKALMQNPDQISGRLMDKVYTSSALVPSTDWLPGGLPEKPDAELEKVGNQFVLTLNTTKDSWLWVVKKKFGNRWETDIYPGWKQSIAIPETFEGNTFSGAVVTVVNELGKESTSQILES